MRWHGIDGSPYRYDLSFPARGAVPAELRHDLRGRDLARIRVTYAAQGADALHGVVRAGDTISSGLSMVCDGQGNLGEILPGTSGTGSVTLTQTLYRDGELVGRSDQSNAAIFPVPPAAGRYELRAALVRNGPWWQPATAIDAAWTFPSGHTDVPSILPLLTVRATADVDADNTTRRGALHLPIRLHRQDREQPPSGCELAVEYSSEDGKTWRAAPLSRTASSAWTARVHSAGRGYLSLRFHARDRQGNALTQTVIRAIRIR